jgi:predicted hotdog family 3-hydroxylacyl-ACP dehydratase
MRLVDTLDAFDGSGGSASARLPADSLLASADGSIDEAAFAELIAQGYAAVKGYDDRVKGRPPRKGYLVGIRRLRVLKAARAGETLRIDVSVAGSFTEFAVVDGTVSRDGELLAEGSLKLWIDGGAS